MNARDTVVLAVRTMRASKLRTALTAVGITIGIAAVILLVGLGNGMQDSLNRNASKSAKGLVVYTGVGDTPGARVTRRLTDQDAAALADKARAPAIDQVVPQFTGSGVIRTGENTANVTVFGTGPGYENTLNQRLAVGRTFDEVEDRTGARVVVIGQGLVDLVYNGNANSAIGQQVTIGRLPFRVIGVMQRSSGADRLAFMPLRTARTVLLGGINRLSQIGIVAESVQDVPAAMRQIRQVMDVEHRIDDVAVRDYVVDAALIRVERVQKYLGYLKSFTIGIAGIALLVGAVGVANILFISVHERRREIGIRRAVGAHRSSIVRQVLAESTLIAGLGGLAGIVLGVALTLLAAVYLPGRLAGFGTITVSVTSVVVAAAISVGIGMLAGLPPALRAARMQPVEALRG